MFSGEKVQILFQPITIKKEHLFKHLDGMENAAFIINLILRDKLSPHDK